MQQKPFSELLEKIDADITRDGEEPHDTLRAWSGQDRLPGGVVNIPNRGSDATGPTNDPADDPINPSHYRKHPSGIECIEVVRHMNFNVGNAMKYIWRYMDKGDPVENLKKAQWYLDDEIRRLEGQR